MTEETFVKVAVQFMTDTGLLTIITVLVSGYVAIALFKELRN